MSQRRNRTKMWPSKGLFLPLLVVALGAMLLAIGGAASAGPIGNASGFEDDDGNLVVNSTFDWNGFSPVTWTGSAPYQSASKTASGWVFNGLGDAQKLSTDTGFAGGTKQDVDCAGVIGSSAPNKDDLKRIYIAHKTVNGHIYLMLAWVRIPQNSTSSSTHVGVEFGEAGIDLTGDDIFTENQCTNFGQAEGVSRSSGNSGTAAMEDLVGPGKVTISNCPQPTMTTSASCAPPTGCPITSSGVALTDTATLSDGPSTGDGTLTFHLYSNATCTTEVTGSPVTRTV